MSPLALVAAVGLPVALGGAGLGAITIVPDPVAFQIGSIPVYWYGVCYALGLAAVYVLLTRRAREYGQDPEHVGSALLIVAVAALIGGRLYHVIDQWELYAGDPISIILPPYSGLGVYGGLLTGTLAAFLYLRWQKLPFWTWADIVAPGLFVMQAIGRWGNFFNQELYGPPTDLPWGIAIDCDHRIQAYPCTSFPFETTFFHPLFLYESISGILGAIALIWIGRRFRASLRPGDLLLIFFIWYAVVRFVLEGLRTDNWTVLGIPTAQLISLVVAVGAFLFLVYRHGRPRPEPEEDEEAGEDEIVWDEDEEEEAEWSAEEDAGAIDAEAPIDADEAPPRTIGDDLADEPERL